MDLDEMREAVFEAEASALWFGITWTNDEESVAQTGYVYATVEAAREAALQGLRLDSRLSTEGSTLLGTTVSGMNDPEGDQSVKYAVIQDENDDLEVLHL